MFENWDTRTDGFFYWKGKLNTDSVDEANYFFLCKFISCLFYICFVY